jgi:hypothetical protein
MVGTNLDGRGNLADGRMLKIRVGPARGSGWAIGKYGLLTARHVIVSALNSADAECLAVPDPRPRQPGFPCTVMWQDEQLDLAVLAVQSKYRRGWAEAVGPGSNSVLAEPGTEPIEVIAVGYPEASVEADAPHPEQVSGLLTPAGGAAGRPMPFDIATSAPEDFSLWEGMSGAAVCDKEGRILGVVVQTDHARQERRLFVTPLPDPARNRSFRQVLIQVGAQPVLDAVNAPRMRKVLRLYDERGRIYRLGQVPDEGLFGARKSRADIDTQGNMYYPYKHRELDDHLAEALRRRADGMDSRVLLLVGSAMSGKSRAGSHALLAQTDLLNHPLLFPRVGIEVGVAAALAPASGAVLWLDDINNFSLDHETLHSLQSRPKLIVIGTLRSDVLRIYRDSPQLRPIWDAITDNSLVERFNFPDEWTKKEQRVLRDAEPHIRAKVAAGLTLGEVLGAAEELHNHLATADPFSRAVASTIIDWARAGLPGGTPLQMVRELWPIYLPKKHAQTMKNIKGERAKRFDEALRWLLAPVDETAVTLVTRIKRTHVSPNPHGWNPYLRPRGAETLIADRMRRCERLLAEDYLVANPLPWQAKISRKLWIGALRRARDEQQPSEFIYRVASNARRDGERSAAEYGYRLAMGRSDAAMPSSCNALLSSGSSYYRDEEDEENLRWSGIAAESLAELLEEKDDPMAAYVRLNRDSLNLRRLTFANMSNSKVTGWAQALGLPEHRSATTHTDVVPDG